jgi:hypothetical protein
MQLPAVEPLPLGQDSAESRAGLEHCASQKKGFYQRNRDAEGAI